MKPVSSKWISAEVFRCIHTQFNAAHKDIECFNQLQAKKIDILNINIEYWYLKLF